MLLFFYCTWYGVDAFADRVTATKPRGKSRSLNSESNSSKRGGHLLTTQLVVPIMIFRPHHLTQSLKLNLLPDKKEGLHRITNKGYKDRYLPKVLASSKTANSSSPVISFLAFSLFPGCDALLCFAGGDENGSLCSSTTFSFFGLEDRLRLILYNYLASSRRCSSQSRSCS